MPSVREAFAELQAQPNTSLELEGFQDGALVMRMTYAGQDARGRQVIFDPATREFL